MGIFKKKLSDEEKEEQEIFHDVTCLRGKQKDNQKKIKKYQKNLERKYYRMLLLLLAIIFPVILAYDIKTALDSDVWNPINIEYILNLFDKERYKTDIGFVDWFLSLPLSLVILLLFLVLLLLF